MLYTRGHSKFSWECSGKMGPKGQKISNEGLKNIEFIKNKGSHDSNSKSVEYGGKKIELGVINSGKNIISVRKGTCVLPFVCFVICEDVIIFCGA